jgi:hypothetical protein
MKKYNVIVVFSKDFTKTLMCKRTKEPYKGMYNLVGGKISDRLHENYKRGLLTRNFFDFQYVIGKGGFGKVSLIEIKVFYILS